MTHVRRSPSGFNTRRAVKSGNTTDTAKNTRARGENHPPNPGKVVGDIPRALGISLPLDRSGYAVRRRVLGRVLRRERYMHNSRHDDSENRPRTNTDTPPWVNDTTAVTAGDLREPTEVDTTCPDCVENAARAVYNVVDVPHPSGFVQLLDRHGFALRGEGEDTRLWIGDDGARVVTRGNPIRDGAGGPHLSYVSVRGPAATVEAFVEDLLALAPHIKRELRAPALLEDIPEDGVVSDADRLVGRARAASVVSRLAAPGGEDE